MCTKNQLKAILDTVVATARTALGDRLRGAYLYGSYARGDYDAESDVTSWCWPTCRGKSWRRTKSRF